MAILQAEMKPFNYLSGKDFTEKLKIVTKCDTYLKMADVYGIPRTTITTWHTHERTSFELIVRTHLATGASVRYMALGEGEPFPTSSDISTTDSFDKFEIINGQLEKVDIINIGVSTLNDFGIKPENLIIIDVNGCNLFINKAESQAASGDYLINIDGVLSINHLQRLPERKIAIAFGNTTSEVSEENIKVIGRVAMEMKKK